MICQIYPVKSALEALALIEAGANYLGIVPEDTGHGSSVPEQTALDIIKTVGDKATRVVISLYNDPEKVLETALKFTPDILHVSGSEFRATGEFRDRLKSLIPGIKLMHAVQVTDFSSVDIALALQDIADYIILDTGADAYGIGASGRVHDWNVSRKIVELSKVPVILAGGLGPHNVYEAVMKVRPFGVDSMTHTHKYLSDGSYVKDIEKVRTFCAEARRAEADYAKL